MTTMTKTYQHPDQVMTSNRGLVRITRINPNARLVINGRTIHARDIPLSIFTLDCSHKDKGIAVSTGDTIFCEPCQDYRKVTSARG